MSKLSIEPPPISPSLQTPREKTEKGELVWKGIFRWDDVTQMDGGEYSLVSRKIEATAWFAYGGKDCFKVNFDEKEHTIPEELDVTFWLKAAIFQALNKESVRGTNLFLMFEFPAGEDFEDLKKNLHDKDVGVCMADHKMNAAFVFSLEHNGIFGVLTTKTKEFRSHLLIGIVYS